MFAIYGYDQMDRPLFYNNNKYVTYFFDDDFASWKILDCVAVLTKVQGRSEMAECDNDQHDDCQLVCGSECHCNEMRELGV
jgi:hypothetical protein